MRRLASLSSTVIAAALLAACSNGPAASQLKGLSPAKAVAKACQASLSAGGVTASSTVQVQGAPELKAEITYSGANSQGTLDYGKGGRAEEIGTATAMYLKGDLAFWRTVTAGIKIPDKVLTAMPKGWFSVSAKAASPNLRLNILRYGDPRFVVKGCTGKVKGVSAAGKGSIDGQAVLRFQAVDPSGTKVSISASNEGEPYVLKLAADSGSTKLNLDYSNYGATVDVSAPKGSVDLLHMLSVVMALSGQGL